jgi:hypothetical protein
MDIENALLFSKRILKLNQNSGANINHKSHSKLNNNSNISFNNNTSFLQKNVKTRDRNNSTSKEKEANSNCVNSEFESMEESSESDIDNNKSMIIEIDTKKKEESKLLNDTQIQSKLLPINPPNLIFDPYKMKQEGINGIGMDSKSREFSNKFYKLLNLEEKNIKYFEK